jgi:hypothetical protein
MFRNLVKRFCKILNAYLNSTHADYSETKYIVYNSQLRNMYRYKMEAKPVS